MAHQADQEKWARGAAKMEDVYQGVVPVVPQGFMDFADIMTEDLESPIAGVKPGSRGLDKSIGPDP